MLAREENYWKRNIREAIENKTERPTLNCDTGYGLPAIFDDLLSHDRPDRVVMWPVGQHQIAERSDRDGHESFELLTQDVDKGI